jgi:hypothetical protein
MAGMARAATRGNRIIVVSQGNSMGGMVENIYLFAVYCIKFHELLQTAFAKKNTQPP